MIPILTPARERCGDESDALVHPSAREVIIRGYCTPNCLLALVPDGDCKCRCGGQGHGVLAEIGVEFDPRRLEMPDAATRPDPFKCAGCTRKIASHRMHYALGVGKVRDDRVVCADCMSSSNSRGFHAKFWPWCPVNYHDAWDHPRFEGTRAELRWSVFIGYRVPPTYGMEMK